MWENNCYTYRVTWTVDDGKYVALCPKFLSSSWLASDPEVALLGIRQVVADVVSVLEANHEDVPEPLAGKAYSGRFMLGIPPSLHKLAIEAAEAGAFMNWLVSD